jgi:UDP-GlcNAc:undecaprenyl-phosphate GlcNAc-1-phosphate transferase
MLAAIGSGTLAGFIYWNWFPARVYLGTTGSWFLGLYIGMVAMVGGGKIATTLLVLAWPALDALCVIAQRLWQKKRPWQGDRHTHFHYRLAARGLTPPAIAIIAGTSSVVLGTIAIALHTYQKILALCIIALTMATTVAIVIRSRYTSF